MSIWPAQRAGARGKASVRAETEAEAGAGADADAETEAETEAVTGAEAGADAEAEADAGADADAVADAAAVAAAGFDRCLVSIRCGHWRVLSVNSLGESHLSLLFPQPVPVLASSALRRGPVRVVAFGRPYALYRDAHGVPAAVDDRCPHRFAPLSAGRVRSDGRLACGYHGWHFDRHGSGCSPSQPTLSGCDVQAHHVLEEHGMIWLAAPSALRAIDAEMHTIANIVVDGSIEAACDAVVDAQGRFGMAGVVKNVRVDGLRLHVSLADGSRRILCFVNASLAKDGANKTAVVVLVDGPPPSRLRRFLAARKSAPVERFALSRDVRDELAKNIAAATFGESKRRLVVLDEAKSSGKWAGFRNFRVAAVTVETADVRSYVLEPEDGAPLPDFLPGQHVTVRLDIPGRDRPTVRCYSLSDRHSPDRYRITIKHAEGGLASTHLHGQIREGMRLALKAPTGRFVLDRDDPGPVVLIGAGVGVTPLLCMARTLGKCERPVQLHYGVRKVADVIAAAELEELAAVGVAITVHLSADVEPNSVNALRFRHGRVDAGQIARDAPAGSSFYLCGPSAMMSEAFTALLDAGVPEGRIHYESFGPSSVRKSVDKNKKRLADDLAAPGQVNFVRSGVTLPWDNAAGSILALGCDNGLVLDAGCRLGSCGTCVTKLIAGEVALNATPGEPVPEGMILLCIAVPRGDVSVDA